VNKKVFDWALDRSGMTLDRLEQKLPKIRQWAAGESQPTLRQLEDLAKRTHTPLGFFFLEEPPEERLPVPYFRTLGDEGPSGPSPDLLETIQTMQRRQAWMREFLIEQGQEGLPFVRCARTDEQPTSVGQRMRNALGLDQGWAAQQPSWMEALRFLRETVEAKGILVVVNGVVGNDTHRKLDPEEFRGFVLVDEYAPLVFVNGADFKAPQMFTLAHELAHVFFGSSAAFDLREMLPASDPTEQACNRAAAEFLVPEQEMRRVWPTVRDDPEPFQSIARRFKVSALVGARRALDLGLIDRSVFGVFYRNYPRTDTRQPHGGDFYLNQNLRVGQRFGRTVIQAAKEGKLLYREAYRLTGLHGKTFTEYAASLGIRGA
jgi:Zn-dependent peptidase ImmA (M78 family)